MAVNAYKNDDDFYFWASNGGDATVKCYPRGRISDEHLKWMDNLPCRYEDQYRYFVHAGLKEGLPMESQSDNIVIWIRHPRNMETVVIDKYIVHGHTPFKDGPVVLETRCNLDTAAFHTGMAPIAMFDDSVAGKPIKMMFVVIRE
jgi:serine/threonine protein phosphatase 1